MKKGFKRTAVFAVGAAFIPLGVAGLVLPILQGVIFLVAGVILLSIASPTIRSWTERHTRKYPKVHSVFEKMEKRIISIIGE